MNAPAWRTLARQPGEVAERYAQRLWEASGEMHWSPQQRHDRNDLMARAPPLSEEAITVLYLQTLARDHPVTEFHGQRIWRDAGRWIKRNAEPFILVMDRSTWRVALAYDRADTERVPAMVPDEQIYGVVLARLNATGWYPSIADKERWMRQHLQHDAPYDPDELRHLLATIATLSCRNVATSENDPSNT